MKPRYLTDFELMDLELELSEIVTLITNESDHKTINRYEERINTLIKALEDHSRALSRPPLKLVE